jgi:hypothetical protein
MNKKLLGVVLDMLTRHYLNDEPLAKSFLYCGGMYTLTLSVVRDYCVVYTLSTEAAVELGTFQFQLLV